MSNARDDFYVGYMPQAPDGLGRWLRRTVLGLLALVLITGFLLAKGQRKSAAAVYEFEPTTLRGVVHLSPYPHLVLERPNQAGIRNGSHTSTALLTVFGKVGAEGALKDYDGQSVRLAGSVIHRDGHVIVEVDPSTIERLSHEDAPKIELESDWTGHTKLSLEGEIADSKCYLGVMKPGRGKIHKSCAIRCISGGVPPILVLERDGPGFDFMLLVDTEGRPVGDRILEFVAEPVRVHGHPGRIGHLHVLRIDPAKIERLSARE